MKIASIAAATAVTLGLGVLSANAAPVNYTIDPSHTYPSFEAPHMGISWWRGKVNTSQGNVILDREAKTGTVDITLDAASVDFGHDKMNEHAIGEDFFNVAEHPTITYTGKITFAGGEPSGVDGQMTLLGNTKPLKLSIVSFKCIEHPFHKREVCGADLTGEFNRADFGMDKYADGPLGAVKLRVQAEAVRADAP
jgi:polyisoprenoid-binding protein YceI